MVGRGLSFCDVRIHARYWHGHKHYGSTEMGESVSGLFDTGSDVDLRGDDSLLTSPRASIGLTTQVRSTVSPSHTVFGRMISSIEVANIALAAETSDHDKHLKPSPTPIKRNVVPSINRAPTYCTGDGVGSSTMFPGPMFSKHNMIPGTDVPRFVYFTSGH